MGFTAIAAIESQKASAFCCGDRSLKLSASSCKNPVCPTRSTSGEGAASCALSVPPTKMINTTNSICLNKVKLPILELCNNCFIPDSEPREPPCVPENDWPSHPLSDSAIGDLAIGDLRFVMSDFAVGKLSHLFTECRR